jgi:cell division transport system ATP-binding protein
LSAEIMQLFQDFKSVGASVLIATHDITLINSMSCPIMELSQGRLVRNEMASSLSDAGEAD